jgi:hypothetical protein
LAAVVIEESRNTGSGVQVVLITKGAKTRQSVSGTLAARATNDRVVDLLSLRSIDTSVRDHASTVHDGTTEERFAPVGVVPAIVHHLKVDGYRSGTLAEDRNLVRL